jgi:hypothetical protein
MSKFQTKVITDESQVPQGWMRVSQLCESLADQRKLSEAHTDGLIPAVKLMRSVNDRGGPVWVSPDDARLVLQSEKPEPSKALAGDAASFDAALSMAEMRLTLGRIELILERLAVAAESLATQPNEPAGSWRDMNGEVMN